MRKLVTTAALATWAVAPLVGAAVFLLTPACAIAADHDAEDKSSRSGNREGEAAAREPRKSGRTGDDLESCRRDADGMRGPERSRFMTQCLKDRK